MSRCQAVSAVAGAVFSLALIAGCGSGTPSPVVPSPSMPLSAAPHLSASIPPGTAALSPPAPHGLHRVHDPGQVTGTLTGPCYYRDGSQLPDPRCTPGAYDPAVTAAVLCSGSYSAKSYRPPVYQTSRFKYESAYPAYGLPAGTRTELDHLVPLELGGANDAGNLWPESPPTPNAKDRVEGALHAAVCAGKVRLAAAQRAIAGNWMTAERALGL